MRICSVADPIVRLATGNLALESPDRTERGLEHPSADHFKFVTLNHDNVTLNEREIRSSLVRHVYHYALNPISLQVTFCGLVRN